MQSRKIVPMRDLAVKFGATSLLVYDHLTGVPTLISLTGTISSDSVNSIGATGHDLILR